MKVAATPNNESAFLAETPVTTNEFGGDVFETVTSSAEERGDVLSELPELDDQDLAPIEETPVVPEEAEAEDDAVAESEESDVDSDSDDTDADTDTDADDTDEEEPKAKKPIPNRVPRQRLNKEVERRKAAEARIRELEAQVSQGLPVQKAAEPIAVKAPAIDKEKFKAMQNAMLDGDTDKAMEIYTELNGATIEQTLSAAEARFEEQLTLREQNAELRRVSTVMRESFPELDPASDVYDAKLVDDVVTTRDFFMHQRGMSAGQALERAVRDLANEYGLEDRKPAPEAKKPAVKERKTDVKRKLEAAQKETGKLGGQSAGNKSEIPNIDSISDDQFARLDPKVKARMRGDII